MDIDKYSKNSAEYEVLKTVRDYELPEETAAALNEWLSANDAFNRWFYNGPKRTGDHERLIDLIESCSLEADRVRASARVFAARRDEPADAHLRSALQTSAAYLRSLMATG